MPLSSFDQILPVLVMMTVVVVTRLLDYYFPRDRIRPGTERRDQREESRQDDGVLLDRATHEALVKLLADIDSAKHPASLPSGEPVLDESTRAQLLELLNKLDDPRK
jgi:hypothetical protein